MNPNMRNAKIIEVFEKLGFTNARSFIASGNFMFESDIKEAEALESQIEEALPKYLGFTSCTIIRSADEIQRLIDKKPFGDKAFSRQNYMTATFLKKGGEVFNTLDLTSSKTPEFMKNLEKDYGKEITTRTWNTILRINKLLNK